MEVNQIYFEDINITPPQEIYILHLKTINQISFTSREIDIIACILRGRKASKIASLLSIAVKNVENRIAGIKLKLGCGSQEGIIDFIEKSGKFTFISQYYTSLLIEIAFKQELKKIANMVVQQNFFCYIVYDGEQKDNVPRARQLKKHLELSGVKMFEVKENHHIIPQLLNKNDHHENHIICCLSKFLLKKKPELFSFIPNKAKLNPVIFITLDKTSFTEFSKELLNNVQYVDFTEQENYYLLIFDILKKLLAFLPFDERILNFKKQCIILSDPSAQITLEEKAILPNNNIHATFARILKKRKLILLSGVSLIFFFMLFFYKNLTMEFWNTKLQQSIISTENIKTWNIPRQDNVFVGRKELLENLHSQLHDKKHITQTNFNKQSNTNAVAISACAGLGGIGKTQLALQYVHHTKYPYSIKAWFSAESIDTLKQQYIEFAKALGHNEKNFSFNESFFYIEDWLSKHSDWLLVYDNVNSYEEIETFLPKGSRGSIIITTRKRNWPNVFKILNIDIMTEMESIELIKSWVQHDIIDNEQEEVKRLVKTLGYLPLALAQAGAYIRQNHITISEYLNLYKKHEIELLSDNTLNEAFIQGLNAHPVAITWDISLKTILSEAEKNNEPAIAVEFLTVCAYLAPEKIYKKILLTWLKETYPNLVSPELLFNKHIGLLWKYSMINCNDDYISIHRLVQSVLRHQLQQGFEGKNTIYPVLNLKWYESLLRFFIDNESDFKLNNSFNQLIETREQFKSRFKNQYNDILAELDLIISPIYFNQEKYEDFLKLLNEVNEYLKKGNGSEFLKCKILYLYSAYFRKNGNFNEAEEKINRAIKILENLKKNKSIKHKDLMHLRAKIFFNKSNLCFAKNKKIEQINRNKEEMEISIKLIKEAIFIFNEIHDTRDWLRAIELYGRLLVLTNNGDEVVKVFDKHNELIEKTADDRTKMLFYLTYSDGYFIRKNYKNALIYCNKAREKAGKLMLKNELINIQNKEKEINNKM